MKQRIAHLLQFIYGDATTRQILPKLQTLMALHTSHQSAIASTSSLYFDHTDTILITYGDMVQEEGQPHLQTLFRFLQSHIAGLVTGLHLLPFYPYSSDDGFSVIDYLQVDPTLGTWADVEAFQSTFRLMFDAVINHISQKSDWYQAFLRDEVPYTDYFTVVDPSTDLSAVFRPRSLPLLTPAQTPSGTKYVWTTFSADQIDLNYASPDLLLEVINVLLTYVSRGAALIRLDAIGFIWKEIGTRCLHLPQAHALVQLLRAILDEVAPHVALVTETNVPHHENISYFGDGTNEAQMVYNFSLPPLLLHTFHSGDATILSDWADTLDFPSKQTTFFNFCASHDGIGITPARAILPDEAIDAMVKRVQALGGLISYKADSDGSTSAYELNINYLDALGDPQVDESEALKAKRFLASQAIMLALRGVPGIYFHSLFGSRNWTEGVTLTGRNRTINRQKLALAEIENELQSGLRQRVFTGYRHLLQLRTQEKAFHPQGEQEILNLHPQLFALWRRYNGDSILCVHSISHRPITVPLPTAGTDLLTHTTITNRSYTLQPYQTFWLKTRWPI